MAGEFRKIKENLKDCLLDMAEEKHKGPICLIAGMFLYLLSLLYKSILYLRLFLYEGKIIGAKSFDLKVISVGNVTVGGTGKTPLVELILGILLKQKKSVALISRGYKGIKTKEGFIADEPQMLKNLFPELKVIIDKDRTRALKRAKIRYNCDCAVLDDAFGNLKLKKDLDIVCINSLNPFADRYLLPRGLLRLPLGYLGRADIFMLTHVQLAGEEKVEEIKNKLHFYNKKALIFESCHKPEFFYSIFDGQRQEISFVKNEKVALLCAIADPHVFERTLESLGAQVGLKAYFNDHHCFSEMNIKKIEEGCQQEDIKIIITTAKDEPRLRRVLKNKRTKIQILILKIKLEVVEDAGRFLERISAVFAA